MTRTLAVLALAASLLPFPASGSDTHLRPNSHKYRDSGLPHAKARAGDATIQARALIGSDLVTVVEITTGSLDGTAAPSGTIEKIKLEVDGQPRNFTGVSGATVAVQLDDVIHRTPLLIRASVKGHDGRDMDLVTLEEIVKLRPDLEIHGGVGVPPYALIGEAVTVTALVRETNAEVGARANCVLYADGVAVDRSTGIWVDANGSVTCAFATTFDTAGEKQLRVALETVVPGDYDGTNSSADATLTIYSHLDPLPDWTAGATENEFDEYRYSTRTLPIKSFEESRNTGWTHNSRFRAELRESFDVFAVGFGYQESSDGAVIVDRPGLPMIDRSITRGPQGAQWIQRCGYYSTDDALHVSVCDPAMPRDLDDDDYRNYISVEVIRTAGDAVYQSEGFRDRWIGDPPRYDSWSYNYRQTEGSQVRFGSTIAMTVTMWNDEKIWRAEPFLTLTSSEYHSVKPRVCSRFSCSEENIHQFTKRGDAQSQ